jgi:hypothetical protein
MRVAPFLGEFSVSTYKVEQCRITLGGRHFHFVSYDRQPANERRGDPAVPAMWYLMGPGKRWPVMEQVAGQAEVDIERSLLAWLKAEGLGRISSAS